MVLGILFSIINPGPDILLNEAINVKGTYLANDPWFIESQSYSVKPADEDICNRKSVVIELIFAVDPFTIIVVGLLLKVYGIEAE